MELIFKHKYGDGAYGLLYKNEQGTYDVYEIPLYGGEEQFVKNWVNLAPAVEHTKSLT